MQLHAIRPRLTLALLFALSLLGCGDAEEADLETRAQASQAVGRYFEPTSHWMLTGGVETRTWSSGYSRNNLSGWRGVDCRDSGAQYYLDQLTAHKEPSANLDAFVARMTAHCREITWSHCSTQRCREESPHDSRTVYTANARSSGSDTSTAPNGGASTGMLPKGLNLRVNSGDGYVKNLGFRWAGLDWVSRGYKGNLWADPNGYVEQTNVVPGGYAFGMTYTYPLGTSTTYLNGDHVELECREGFFMTGLSVRHTPNGKIRAVRISCREVTDTSLNRD